jgi:acetyl-CoA carboxylase alpha subunit
MQYLDFEQPIEELEKKIEELNELSVGDEVLKPEIDRLRKKPTSFANRFSQTLRGGSAFSLPATPSARTRSITST